MSKSNHYTGLSAREVEESRARHGVNVLTPPAKMPLWKRFLVAHLVLRVLCDEQ